MERIPREIVEFFEAYPGQSFVIKGRPGTGKTILALEILREVCDRGNGLYLTTRVEPKRLYDLFPWIRDFIPEQNMIDATQAKIRRVLGVEGGGLKAPDYDVVLSFFRSVYEDATEMENPMIVIDSWNGILAHLGLERFMAPLTQGICEFCRDTETHVIFVVEQDTPTSIDYAVDGMVTLYRPWMGSPEAYTQGSEEIVERRRIREIEINKLRGFPIRQSRYLFTLHEGRFRFFPPYMEDLSITPKPIPDISEACMSTGIRDLDDILGGLPSGSFHLWEVRYGVGKRYDQMLLQVCLNASANGRGIVGIPPLRSSVLERGIQNLRTYHPKTYDVSVEVSSFTSVIQDAYERTKKPAFIFISLDELGNVFSLNNAMKFLGSIADISGETEMIASVLLIGQYGSEIAKAVAPTVDSHIVLSDVNGALTLHGVRPPTGLYGVTSSGEGIQLTPIV